MFITKVRNMISPRSGSPVANQFIMEVNPGIAGNFKSRRIFQSYDSIIAIVTVWNNDTAAAQGRFYPDEIILDEKYWNFSTTTSKYRNQFLGETTAETKAKIASGEYKLENLNK